MAKKKRGPKPRPTAETRTVVIPVRLRPSEHAALEALAREASRSMSDFLVVQALGRRH